MKTYNIYMEGFRATGQSEPASLIGTEDGETFKDACAKFMEYVYDPNSRFYDKERNTYWGCRLFDNMEDASRSFG